jgi:hypothetical protein
MLFNLTTQQLFKCIKHHWAIRFYKDYGPWFGNSELLALLQPFNRDNACLSSANRDGYQIEMDNEKINKLTNLKCESEFEFDRCDFTISELEVWEIIYEN